MNVKFWQPAREYLKYKDEIDQAIQRCLSNGQLCLGFGPDIEEFEKNFAERIGVKHAVMCGGGTHALYLAYKALGIGPGDEVITTSHTFIATIDQIVAVGATPILVDIGEDGLIDPSLIEKAITPRTKAIVPVHLEGKVCDMDSILKIALLHGLQVVEDSAQAISASYQGKYAGSMGDIGCFSMYPAKVLGSIGNAGMVVTNNDSLADKLRMLRCNSNIGKNLDLTATYGVQLEPDNIHAAVLNVKLKYLTERLLKRAEIAVRYDEEFKDLPLILPTQQEGRVYQDYVIRVPERKEEFVEHLKENGVGILGHNLIPNHHYPNLKLYFQLPKTDRYIAQQVRIPCNPDLTEEEINHVIETIKNFF